MTPRPYYLAIAIIFVLLGIYGYGHHKGWSDRDAEMQAEIALKNEEARQREQELNKQINAGTVALQEANDAITQKQSALDRAISSGRVRLNSSCVQTSSSSGAASSSGDETSSESDRQTLRLIAEIVAQGDRNTEQLNACIDAYNAVREQVNGQR